MADLLDSVISNVPPEGERREEARKRQEMSMGNYGRASQAKMTYRGKRRGDPAFVQEFSQGHSSTAEAVTLETQLYLSESDYYFELQPFEFEEMGEAGAGAFMPLPPATPLRAGRTYRVRVSLSQNEYRGSFQPAGQTYGLSQRPFKLPGEVFVQLCVVSQDPNVLDAVGAVVPAQGRLSLDDPEAQLHDFEFTIQKNYGLEFTLELLFWKSDGAKLPYSAAWLRLTLVGSEPAPPPVFNEVFALPAKASPPSDAAILHISQSREGGLRLLGWAGSHSDSSLSLDVRDFGWVDPEGCPNEDTYLQRLRNSFHDYNIDQAKTVSGWFEKALQRYGERCSVVIVDEAGVLIPWEMFKLTDGRYLGAHALVVRWAEAQYGGYQAVASVEGPRYEGRVSAYIHPLDAEKIGEMPDMDRLLPDYKTTPQTLERDLLPDGAAGQVGLVYLCYGGILYYGDEQNVIAGFSRFKPYEEDVLIRFNLVSGRLNPRPIFFANAPYSGRILKSGQQSCGLARATLRQVAASYIGTLGPIERSYAARFAQVLLEEAASDAGVKPAELLRRLRAEAIARVMNRDLPEDEFIRAYNEFAYPFMYVHYGHPLDWIKINRAPAGIDGGAERV